MLKKASDLEIVFRFLEENLIINLNIIGIIENEPGAEIYVDDLKNPTGVLVRLSYFHYMYTENDIFIEKVIEEFFNKPGWYGFSGLYKPIAKKIRGRFENNWESCCEIYYFPEAICSQKLIKNTVSSVKVEDAEIIDRLYTYRNEDSLEHIKKDIQNRPSSAIYNGKEISSWVLVHNDNSMGVMHTKDEYRNKGYAVDVTLDLTSKIIKMGKKPFLQINILNKMSPGLALKCGFVKGESCDWFGFIVGTPKEIIEGSKESRDKLIEAFRKVKMDEMFGEALTSSINTIGMHLFIMNMKEDKGEIPSFKIDKVNDIEQRNLWCKISASSYDLPHHREEELEGLLNRVVSSEKYPFNLYMGILNGEPISTIAVQKIDDWSGSICLYSTKQPQNKQGIYSTLIRMVLEKEQSMGCEIVFINTSKELSGTLKEIGFKEDIAE
ncbi:MAG: hypothetical protein K0R09_3686 [Clostridiales bacterium]|nr:hypothetical protein [Clostridiales bacterium]